ncbi:hypothetical protein [Enterococcus rotai]|uniref:hypothetical protein n=1 Tax=Enterococcus rotai TaxID=118060 RepID=UPI0035C71697
MLLIQQGPAAGPKLKKITENEFCDGIIWDPRDLTPEKINKYVNENSSYNDLVKILEFKQYYQQFANSDKKKLQNYSQFPTEIMDRNYLRSQDNLEKLVLNSMEFQQLVSLDYFCTPTFYIENFGHRIIERIIETWEINNSYILEQEIEKPLLATMVVSENAFSSYDYISEFLEDLESFSEKISGIYLSIDRNEMNPLRHKFEVTHLTNILQFIFDLKMMGFTVIVGYTSVEGLLYSAVGADYIGTGWFYSLRKFNRIQKGLPAEKSFGIQKKRYTSIKLFSEVPLQETIYNTGKHSHKLILDGCLLDDNLIAGEPIDNLNSNDCYLQHFESMDRYVKLIDMLPDVSEKIEMILELLETAKKNVTEFNNLPNNTVNINSDHIVQYKEAINLVKKNNFL